MKKVALLIAVMLLVSAFTFAQDEPFSGPNGAPTVSGSVTLVAGYDLDTQASGFDNSTDLTLRFPLADGADTKGGDDDIYGEITINEIGWMIQPGKFYDSEDDDDSADASELDASISAKIVMGDAFIKLGCPGFDMNNVDIGTDYAVDANIYKDDNWKNWTDGMSAGYETDMFTIEVKVASHGNYAGSTKDDTDTDDVTGPFDNDVDGDDDDEDTTPLNSSNLYILGASVTVKPMDGVEIPVSVAYDMFASPAGEGGWMSLLGIGANPSVEIAPLTVSIPVDVVMTMPNTDAEDAGVETSMGIDVKPTITYDIIEDGSNVSVNFLYGMYDGVAGVVNAIAELGLTVEETETDGFVDGLSAKVEVALTDILDYMDVDADMGWTVDAEAAYNIDGIKPYINGGFGSDDVLDLGVGVTLMAEATGIDNTEITIDYANDDLYNIPEMGRVTATVKVSY